MSATRQYRHPRFTGTDMLDALAKRQGDMGTCAICKQAVVDAGQFWEGHEIVVGQRREPGAFFPRMSICHPGCLHPEVIVVTEPLEGKTTENLHVGRLKACDDGNGDWWLVLNPIVVSKWNAIHAYEVSVPWSRVRHVELRYAR